MKERLKKVLYFIFTGLYAIPFFIFKWLAFTFISIFIITIILPVLYYIFLGRDIFNDMDFLNEWYNNKASDLFDKMFNL